jgi:hypothetical protein
LINEFLESEIRLLDRLSRLPLQTHPQHFSSRTALAWNRSKVGLIELVMALVKSKIIVKPGGEPLTIKEGIHHFAGFLGTEVKQWESKASKARQRKSGFSVLLNELKDSIEQNGANQT